MNTEKRIAVACFIGAILGTIIALELNKYFWWLGILIGGIVGYVSYEFKSVAHAFRKARSVTRQEYQFFLSGMWGAFQGVMIAVSQVFLTLFLVLLNGFFWSALFFLFVDWVADENILLESPSFVIPVTFIMSSFIGTILATDSSLSLFAWEHAARTFKSTNPLTVACWWIPVGVHHVAKRLPWFVCLLWMIISDTSMFTWKVTKRTFVLVHSEIRLLCMTDAMFGALVGYGCGNALIGGLVGAVCGVLNYKLVSVRWLKLAPR